MCTKILSFTLCALLLFITSTAQQKKTTPLEKEIKVLHHIVYKYIEKKDIYRESRNPEFILMILEVDTVGNIKNTHLFADKKNMDSSYSILERMTPENFSGQKFELWKGKIVNLPIYSLTENKRGNYVEDAILHQSSTVEFRKAVMVRPLYYLTPGAGLIIEKEKGINTSIKAEPMQAEVQKKDSAQNQLNLHQ